MTAQETLPGLDERAPRSFSALLRDVQAAGQDFEFYPTTDRMLDVIARYIPVDAESIMDIGAGDGRVLLRLAKKCQGADLYAIEKSTVLLQAQPGNVIPVGTDLFEQNLACLPVGYLVANPPYSEYETWACTIIESGYAKKAFLIIPQRWKENDGILQSLKKRGATARVLHSDNFFDAPRQARAVIDIVEISYPKDRWHEKPLDPFDTWFDQNVGVFEEEEEREDYAETHARDNQEIARIRFLNSITEMVTAYQEEYARMEANYRAIFSLDYALLKELGVSKENVRDGIKKKMAGLKGKYWTILFERLHTIIDRLSTATKKQFLEKLLSRNILAFTEGNAYSIVLWAIKNANAYFDQQTVALYRELSTFDGVLNYKSNQKTWKRDGWRYTLRNEEDRPTHYALDYRIVVERWRAIGYGDNWEYPNNLAQGCHEIIADVVAVLFNLGFPSRGARSLDRQWHSGEWQDWHRVGNRAEILFQVKAFKNGNLHFRFLPDAMRALNVEAGRLLGWLKSPAQVTEELGYSEEEAQRFYSCMKMIAPGSARLLLGSGDEA